MRKKNVLAIISAVLMILVWSGAAFAVDTVTMNVTSEPIRALSPSDKAGGLTFIFDAGTQLLPGDIITMDLPLNVTLAQAVNLEISPTGLAVGYAAVPQTDGPFVDPTNAAVEVGAGVYFRVTGSVATQRITIEVLGVAGDSITAGAGVDDRLELTILDQSINADYTNLGVWVSTPLVPPVAATLAENTLCINVSAYSGSTVNGSFDSAGDKYTFVPSNPQIAHVVAALAINFDPCKGAAPGYIVIGDRVTQGSESCTYFDNESGNGYCPVTHFSNDAILASSNPFDQAIYTVQLDILVNGQGGNNGVYWTNQNLQVDASTTDPGCVPGASTDIVGVYTYLNGTFGLVTAGAPNSGECDVSQPPGPDQRAVTLISPQTNLGLPLVPGADYLIFDFPALNYDVDEITSGDVVTIRVTINKVPCGSIFTGEMVIGTFGCLAGPATSGLLFPYFTEVGASADAYWDGFVITNPGMTDVSALVTVIEADGDQGTITVTVPAMSQYVNLLSAMAFTHSVGTGTLGDSSCYVRVNGTGGTGIDGFGMMGRPDTGEAMGYLPRLMSF